MTKPVILTGVRANNDLHIGNYFGAILPIIDMARRRSAEYTVNLFIPDLHSFTTPIDHSQLFDSIMNNARVYTAAGLPLDDDAIQLYRQSYVPAHSELTIILNNFVGFGEMERMTQFKDKSAKLSNDRVSVGLFDYPVLMASDILLYNAMYVPVGDDQTQHLEITRDIAERMNHKFGELFTVPEPVAKQHQFFGKDQGLRIKDLQNPTKKMSKSDETGKGVIFLSDTPDAARKKIMSAATDSLGRVHYDKDAQPGISNLLEILTLVRQANGRVVSLRQTVDEFTGLERYGEFKKIVADEMAEFLADFQARLAQVDNDVILRKLKSSEITASQTASQTLLRVQKAVGLRR
ncbi:tryptophan--tRNA ligase [TM7 phylum sp. oral taxon 349]|jgi:tryptophanyl-tRNA synthetase|nr:tryptophan--tRNA ligase [TM7 phylum sp. oral taxon 349]TWP23373.1 tryptophan--tRNA ligase [TM7 phylum sp. oral taxon 349]